jgi:hypothetical protein
MDLSACNWDQDAIFDDGSCSEEFAPNHDPEEAIFLFPSVNESCQSFLYCNTDDSEQWPGEYDVWFKFEAGSAGVDISGSSENFDVKLALFDSEFNILQWANGSSDQTETVSLSGYEAGADYYLAVSSSLGFGSYNLCTELQNALGDLSGDGEINTSDLLILLGNIGCTGDCPGDLNSDGVVNIMDILIFLGLL